MISNDDQNLMEQLQAPFAPPEVKCKPGAVNGTRALVLWFVDARAVMSRLDAVVGIENWFDQYEFLADGCVLCKLSIRINGEWLTKMDVGAASDQPDAGDRRKSAVSDSIKSAAVHFGIGRFLYRMPVTWTEWDATKKRFVKTPTLPTQALTPAVAAANRGSKLEDRA